MSEFCRDDFEILYITSEDPIAYETYTLPQILPFRFTPSHLEE